MKAWSILYNFIIPYLCCLHISHNTNNLETLISYIQLPYFCLMIKLVYLSTGYYRSLTGHDNEREKVYYQQTVHKYRYDNLFLA